MGEDGQRQLDVCKNPKGLALGIESRPFEFRKAWGNLVIIMGRKGGPAGR